MVMEADIGLGCVIAADLGPGVVVLDVLAICIYVEGGGVYVAG